MRPPSLKLCQLLERHRFAEDQHKRQARQQGTYWTVVLNAPAHRNPPVLQLQDVLHPKAEHIFRVIKCQFGYTKVRYKGIAKNAAQVFTLIGLGNLYLKRRALMS